MSSKAKTTGTDALVESASSLIVPVGAGIRAGYSEIMVSIRGKLIDPLHVELAEPVPPGEHAIQVDLAEGGAIETWNVTLLTANRSFDFLRDEPDLYE